MVKVTLTGFMGTGKTAVGRQLAARLGCPFVDTDELVERAEGNTIDQLFFRHGEAHFRAAERRAVAAAAATADAVVATGGGAIVDEQNLAHLRDAGPIVCLTAKPDVILSRTLGAPRRPLLAGSDPAARIAELLHTRAEAYARADLTIDTSTLDIAAVVEQIVAFLASWKRRERAQLSPSLH